MTVPNSVINIEGIWLDEEIPSDEGETGDAETLEGTLEETLDETLQESLEEGTVDVVPPTVTEITVMNATKVLALAIARAAPVEISSDMAFSNVIDLDNLCRVRTEDSTYSTIYRPGGSRSHRRIEKSGNYHLNHSRGSIEGTEEDDESITLQSWNTLQTDLQLEKEDGDDYTQKEEGSLCPVFNMETQMHASNGRMDNDERSDDTRDQPEELIFFKADNEKLDTNSKPTKGNGWFQSRDNKIKNEETQLSIRHQKEHVEVVVQEEEGTSKVKDKKGKTTVRFWSPGFSKRFTRMMKKGMKTDQPSVNSASSSSTVRMACEKTVASDKCEDGSMSRGSNTLNSTQVQQIVIESKPSTETDGCEHSVCKDESDVSVLSRSVMSQVSNADVHQPTNFDTALEIVRESIDDSDFEVEMLLTSSAPSNRLLIRDERIEFARNTSNGSYKMQRGRSAQSVSAAFRHSGTLQNKRTTINRIIRSQSLPSTKLVMRGPTKEEEHVDEQSVGTWGSYADDDESKIPPLITPQNVHMKRTVSPSSFVPRTTSNRSRSFPFPMYHRSSAMSMKSHARSEVALQPIQKIDEEPALEAEEEKEAQTQKTMCDHADGLSQNQCSKGEETGNHSFKLRQEGLLEAVTQVIDEQDSSRLDLRGTLQCLNHEKVEEVPMESGLDEKDLESGDITENSDSYHIGATKEGCHPNDQKEDHVSASDDSKCSSTQACEESILMHDSQRMYVVSSIVEEQMDYDSNGAYETPGFEVLEVLVEANGMIEI